MSVICNFITDEVYLKTLLLTLMAFSNSFCDCKKYSSVSQLSLGRILNCKSECCMMDLTIEICLEIQQNKVQEIHSFLSACSALIFFYILENYFN